jgi:hypothetical protein
MLNQLSDRWHLRILSPKWRIQESIFFGIPIQYLSKIITGSLKIAEPTLWRTARLLVCLTMKVVDPPHGLCIANFSQILLGSRKI